MLSRKFYYLRLSITVCVTFVAPTAYLPDGTNWRANNGFTYRR